MEKLGFNSTMLIDLGENSNQPIEYPLLTLMENSNQTQDNKEKSIRKKKSVWKKVTEKIVKQKQPVLNSTVEGNGKRKRITEKEEGKVETQKRNEKTKGVWSLPLVPSTKNTKNKGKAETFAFLLGVGMESPKKKREGQDLSFLRLGDNCSITTRKKGLWKNLPCLSLHNAGAKRGPYNFTAAHLKALTLSYSSTGDTDFWFSVPHLHGRRFYKAVRSKEDVKAYAMYADGSSYLEFVIAKDDLIIIKDHFYKICALLAKQ